MLLPSAQRSRAIAPATLQPQDALGMQVCLGSPLHGRRWLLRWWLRRPRARGGFLHGGDEQQHHQQLSSEEQVDLGHGEKGSGFSEHSLRPLNRFWISSPAKEQWPLAARSGRVWQRRCIGTTLSKPESVRLGISHVSICESSGTCAACKGPAYSPVPASHRAVSMQAAHSSAT